MTCTRTNRSLHQMMRRRTTRIHHGTSTSSAASVSTLCASCPQSTHTHELIFSHVHFGGSYGLRLKQCQDSMTSGPHLPVIYTLSFMKSLTRVLHCRVPNPWPVRDVRGTPFVALRSAAQRHTFNLPYQLGTGSRDRASDAQNFLFYVR